MPRAAHSEVRATMDERILAILGTIGTAVFGLLSVWFYRRSRQVKRLSAFWTGTTLQSRRHSDVRILFREQEIDDLSRLRVLLVNSGTLAIRPNQDFPSSHQGAVVITKTNHATQFLSAAVLAGDVSTSGASAAVGDDGAAKVRFEYLNPGQRLGIEVLYAGPSPGIDIKLIGGEVDLRRGLGQGFMDGLVEELGPLPGMVLVGGLAIWVHRSIRVLQFPYATTVAAIAMAGVIVASVLVTFKLVLPWLRRRRRRVDQERCLDFLAGAERPNNALHPTASGDASGRG